METKKYRTAILYVVLYVDETWPAFLGKGKVKGKGGFRTDG
jgi:hypothetical protein